MARYSVRIVKMGSGSKKVTVDAPTERDALREAEARNSGWECMGRDGDIQRMVGDSISPARIPTQLDPAKVDLLGRAVDALGKRFDAMCEKRADAENTSSLMEEVRELRRSGNNPARLAKITAELKERGINPKDIKVSGRADAYTPPARDAHIQALKDRLRFLQSQIVSASGEQKRNLQAQISSLEGELSRSDAASESDKIAGELRSLRNRLKDAEKLGDDTAGLKKDIKYLEDELVKASKK